MELIEESEAEKQQGALPEPEPRYHTASLPVEKTEHGQAWVRLVGLAVLAVILIILIVLFARWIYHKAHNHAGPTSPATSQNTPAASSNNQPATPAPSSSSNSSNSSSNTSNSSSNSGAASQITNTGPGDVAAIFAGTSLAAAGLHYIISVRRFAKNS